MDSFKVTAIGRLSGDPELGIKGDTVYARFCLVGSDYAGKNEDGTPRLVVTTLRFVAFGTLGDVIAKSARKGDQLIVDARVRANNWTNREGEMQYDYSFVVRGFRFGAPGRTRREEFEEQIDPEEELGQEYFLSEPLRRSSFGRTHCGDDQ